MITLRAIVTITNSIKVITREAGVKIDNVVVNGPLDPDTYRGTYRGM